jgi:SfnB family sulfur acquisition oxidoreductase
MTIAVSDSRPAAHVIASDEEAIAIAHELAARLAPGASQRDQQRDPGRAELALLGASGLLGITVPRAFGGAGAGYTTLAEVVRIISAVDPAIGQVPQNHYITVPLLAGWGTQEQQERFFDEILRRGARFGSAVSERGGKHSADLRTRVVAQPDGSAVIDGTKYYATGCLTSEWIRVAAKDEHGAVVFVLVESDAEGVEVGDDWTAMGQRGTLSGTTVLRSVHVPAGRVLPHWSAGGRPHLVGAQLHLLHAAIEVGIARGAFEDGVAFLTGKARPWGEAVAAGWDTLAEEPHIKLQVGRMVTRLHAAEALLVRAAQAIDDAAAAGVTHANASAASVAVSEAKAFGTEAAVEIASEIFSLSGASAADESLNLNRHWRNARTHSLHDPVRWKYVHAGEAVLSGTAFIEQGALA